MWFTVDGGESEMDSAVDGADSGFIFMIFLFFFLFAIILVVITDQYY